jgi:nicotinate-nucleotide adenylyltransferase
MSESARDGRPRIGIFGGSFDPVHEGHLAVARAAKEAFALDRVLWIVANRSPFKDGTTASGVDRLEMVRRAIAGLAGMEASDLELRRPGPSYTIDTVRAVRAENLDAELYLILGSDTLESFVKWREVKGLMELAAPIVVPRRGTGREVLTRCRETLGDAAAKLESGWVDRPYVDVSSTEIRSRLTAGEALTGLVPKAVEAYVRERGLYR